MLIITIVFIKLIQSISCQYILLNETNLPQKYFYEFDNFLPQGFELKKEEAILLSLKSLDKSANSSLMELCTDKSKTNCVIDHNAIDFKLNIQNLRIIQQANISKVYQEKYNGIPFSHNIHLEIQSQNSFNLMAQIIQYQNCPFDCQNGGNCIQGICVCHKDYLSHDCSIKAYSILNTQTLLNTQFYFLDIHEWIEQQNNKILQFQASLEEESTIITECYAQNPYLLQNNSEIKIQQIDITVKDMNNCLNQINNLGQNQQQQFAYIIIKLKYPQKVQFLTSEIDIDQSVIGIVVGSISLFILIVVVYCVFRCKRDQQKQKKKLEHNLKMEQEQKLKEAREKQMMPEFTYEEVLKRYPGLKSDQECEICLNMFKIQELVRITYCTHIFHTQCIKEWLNKHKTCPMCRESLDFNQPIQGYDQISKNIKNTQVSEDQQPQLIQFTVGPEKNTRLYGDENQITSYIHAQQVDMIVNLEESLKK